MDTHEITIDPERDSDDLVVWHCSCGEWGTDHDHDDAEASIEAHLHGLDSKR